MPGWWVQQAWEASPVLLFSWAFWVIASITLHELGHGWAALRQGDSTPRDAGHMNLNPLVHMGPTSLIMFAVVGIAWGAMPVDPSRFRSRHGDAIVSAAGPVVNLVLAAISLLCLCVWIAAASGHWSPSLEAPDHVYYNFQTFFRTGAMLNLVLLLLNLLPVPPLDGSRILGSFSPSYARFISDERAQGPVLIAFILVFVLAGRVLFGLAADGVEAATNALLGVITPGVEWAQTH